MAATDVDAKHEAASYKQSVIKKGEDIALNIFPEHIVEINKLLKEAPFKFDDMTHVHSDLHIPVPNPFTPVITTNANNHGEKDTLKRKRRPSSENEMAEEFPGLLGSKVFLLPKGTVPINPTISKMVDILKPHLKILVDEVNVVKMWIALLIPKIEDGNNFGVSIQEETLEEIRAVESEANLFYEHISRYHLTRAKLVSKVAKYPHIDDYRHSIKELDERRFESLRLTLLEMRNHYAALHDMISKNLEKIKRPRSANNHENMY